MCIITVWLWAWQITGPMGDCRPALLKGRKHQMVKTQTEGQVKRPVAKNKPMADLGFLFLWGSPGDGWNLSRRSLGIIYQCLSIVPSGNFLCGYVKSEFLSHNLTVQLEHNDSNTITLYVVLLFFSKVKLSNLNHCA